MSKKQRPDANDNGMTVWQSGMCNEPATYTQNQVASYPEYGKSSVGKFPIDDNGMIVFEERDDASCLSISPTFSAFFGNGVGVLDTHSSCLPRETKPLWERATAYQPEGFNVTYDGTNFIARQGNLYGDPTRFSNMGISAIGAAASLYNPLAVGSISIGAYTYDPTGLFVRPNIALGITGQWSNPNTLTLNREKAWQVVMPTTVKVAQGLWSVANNNNALYGGVCQTSIAASENFSLAASGMGRAFADSAILASSPNLLLTSTSLHASPSTLAGGALTVGAFNTAREITAPYQVSAIVKDSIHSQIFGESTVIPVHGFSELGWGNKAIHEIATNVTDVFAKSVHAVGIGASFDASMRGIVVGNPHSLHDTRGIIREPLDENEIESVWAKCELVARDVDDGVFQLIWETLKNPDVKSHPVLSILFTMPLSDLIHWATIQLKRAKRQSLPLVTHYRASAVIPSERGKKQNLSASNALIGGANLNRVENVNTTSEPNHEENPPASSTQGEKRLSPLQKKILQTVQALSKDYVIPPHEVVAAKLGLNPRGQPYTRETINRERSKMRKMGIEV